MHSGHPWLSKNQGNEGTYSGRRLRSRSTCCTCRLLAAALQSSCRPGSFRRAPCEKTGEMFSNAKHTIASKLPLLLRSFSFGLELVDVLRHLIEHLSCCCWAGLHRGIVGVEVCDHASVRPLEDLAAALAADGLVAVLVLVRHVEVLPCGTGLPDHSERVVVSYTRPG